MLGIGGPTRYSALLPFARTATFGLGLPKTLRYRKSSMTDLKQDRILQDSARTPRGRRQPLPLHQSRDHHTLTNFFGLRKRSRGPSLENRTPSRCYPCMECMPPQEATCPLAPYSRHSQHILNSREGNQCRLQQFR